MKFRDNTNLAILDRLAFNGLTQPGWFSLTVVHGFEVREDYFSCDIGKNRPKYTDNHGDDTPGMSWDRHHGDQSHVLIHVLLQHWFQGFLPRSRYDECQCCQDMG